MSMVIVKVVVFSHGKDREKWGALGLKGHMELGVPATLTLLTLR